MTASPSHRNHRIGVVVPQANPTVEPELAALCPPGVDILATRSVHDGAPRARLRAYFEQLDTSLASFGGMALDAFGFACTASSYLLDPGEEARRVGELEQAHGLPVITAAAAIEAALRHLGARRIALASPYPPWIHELSLQHWSARGFEVVAGASAGGAMQDTREIYTLDTRAAGERLARALAGAPADLVLITGTGMPSLALIPELRRAVGRPVISSNLCLAWACLRAAGVAPGTRAPTGDDPLLAGW